MRFLVLVLLAVVVGCGGDEALHMAAASGDLETVKELVGGGAAVDARAGLLDWMALHLSARFGHLSVVEYLVDSGADVHAADRTGETALHYAAHGGHLEVVKYLVGLGASVDARDTIAGYTALLVAAWNGDLETVKFLVGQGAAVDAMDRWGDTPRDYAASCSTDTDNTAERRAGCAAVVEYLDSL